MAPALTTGGNQLFRHLDRQRRMDREWLEGLLAEVEEQAQP
jgi:hypothetical protein